MALVIETGSGVRGANAYVPVAYVTAYLTARNRQAENNWTTATDAVKEAAVVAATDYVDKRFSHRFKGVPKVTFDLEYAEATLTFSGLPAADEELTIGDDVYTFVSSLSGAAYEVLIGGTVTEAVANLEAAVNAGAGAGLTYGLGTPQSRHSSALAAGEVLTLTASAPGTSGALTVLEGPVTNATISGFAGARDGGIQPLCWPRTGAYDERGIAIEGVPERLKMGVAEYAVRALSSTLLPDPTTDGYGGRINSRAEQVGPIREEYRYGIGSGGSVIFTAYPAADKLIRPLLLGSGGGVIRG